MSKENKDKDKDKDNLVAQSIYETAIVYHNMAVLGWAWKEHEMPEYKGRLLKIDNRGEIY